MYVYPAYGPMSGRHHIYIHVDTGGPTRRGALFCFASGEIVFRHVIFPSSLSMTRRRNRRSLVFISSLSSTGAAWRALRHFFQTGTCGFRNNIETK